MLDTNAMFYYYPNPNINRYLYCNRIVFSKNKNYFIIIINVTATFVVIIIIVIVVTTSDDVIYHLITITATVTIVVYLARLYAVSFYMSPTMV